MYFDPSQLDPVEETIRQNLDKHDVMTRCADGEQCPEKIEMQGLLVSIEDLRRRAKPTKTHRTFLSRNGEDAPDS